jgi:hypothetical protein
MGGLLSGLLVLFAPLQMWGLRLLQASSLSICILESLSLGGPTGLPLLCTHPSQMLFGRGAQVGTSGHCLYLDNLSDKAICTTKSSLIDSVKLGGFLRVF